MDARSKVMRLNDKTAQCTVAITQNTMVWLDRTKLKAANLSLTLSDIRAGQRVEIRRTQGPRGDTITARWIKVDAQSLKTMHTVTTQP